MRSGVPSEISNFRCFDYRYINFKECCSESDRYKHYKSCESAVNNNYPKMCMQDSKMLANISETFSSVASKCPIGSTVRSVLRRAMLENRLTIGLLPAINHLSQGGGALFCITAQAIPGDSLNHMQEVLLEAFCAENGIFVVKVDSVDKLRDLIGCYHHKITDFSCVLVHIPFAENSSYEEAEKSLSQAEISLIDHCHNTWGLTPQPIIKLPEK